MTPQEELALRRAVAAAKTPEEELAARRALKQAETKAAQPDLGDAASSLWSSVKSAGKDFLRGAGNTLALFTEGQAMNNANVMPDADPRAPADALAKALPVPKDEGPGEKARRFFFEGAGGMAAGGPMTTMRAPVTALGVGGLVNEAAGWAGEAAKAGFPDSPKLQAALPLLTGLAAGPAAAWGMGKLTSPASRAAGKVPVSQTPSEAALRQAAPSPDSPVWTQVDDNLQALKSVPGLQSVTLADAFPPNSKVRALAETARGAPGGEALAQKLNLRDTDLALIRDTVGGPRVAAAEVAERASAVSNQALENLRGARTSAFRGQFAKVPAGSTLDVNSVAANLRSIVSKNRADPAKAESKVWRDAEDAMLQSLLSPDPQMVPQAPVYKPGTVGKKGFKTTQLVTPPPVAQPKLADDALAASRDLKQMQEAPVNPNSATGGRKLDAATTQEQIAAGNEALAAGNPAYGQAQDVYRKISETLVNPATRGPLGIMSGRAFKENAPVPVSRMEGAFTGQDPATIERTLQGLGRVGLGSGGAPNATLPNEIARALIQQRTAKGDLNVGNSVRGQPGSRMEEELTALAKGGGLDPDLLKQQLSASDLMQGFSGATARTPPHLPWYSFLLRPFRALDITASGMSQADFQREIAKVLSDPNQRDVLMRAAQFDPNLRRQLAALGMVVPANQELSK